MSAISVAEEEDPVFRQMGELYAHPVVQDFYHHVEVVAGFEVPPSIKSSFQHYHHHCFDPPKPAFTADWGEASPIWQWQKLHSESIFGSAQSAIAAVLYHRENLLRLERDVLSFVDLDKLKELVGKSGFGGGNTQKLDFEYHGFVFAYRRGLDYLARGVAALLKEHFHSFRRLPTLLHNHSKHAWVCRLIDTHQQYSPKLETFLGTDDERSTRDKIAHYLHVPAGCLNANALGVFFAGGGESLDHSRKLGDVIDDYVRILRDLIRDFLSTMEEGLPKKA